MRSRTREDDRQCGSAEESGDGFLVPVALQLVFDSTARLERRIPRSFSSSWRVLSYGPAVPSEDPNKQSKIIGKYLRYSYLGTQLFVSVGLLTGAGLWLDRKAGTIALFTLIGLALGFGAGFYSIYVALFPPSVGRRAAGDQTIGRDADSKSGRVENDGKQEDFGDGA